MVFLTFFWGRGGMCYWEFSVVFIKWCLWMLGLYNYTLCIIHAPPEACIPAWERVAALSRSYEWWMNAHLYCFRYALRCQCLKSANKKRLVQARTHCLHSSSCHSLQNNSLIIYLSNVFLKWVQKHNIRFAIGILTGIPIVNDSGITQQFFI